RRDLKTERCPSGCPPTRLRRYGETSRRSSRSTETRAEADEGARLESEVLEECRATPTHIIGRNGWPFHLMKMYPPRRREACAGRIGSEPSTRRYGIRSTSIRLLPSRSMVATSSQR